MTLLAFFQNSLRKGDVSKVKKLLCFLVSAFLFSSAVFSQESSHTQIVSPDIIYLGDTVTVRYQFKTGAALLSEPSLSLTTDYDAFKRMSSYCFVKKADISCSGSEYILTLEVIPWRTGSLNIPPFDVNTLIHRSQNESGDFSAYMVDPDPFNVNSLVERTGINTIQPPAGPLTVPGTTAFLIVAAIVLVIIFTAILYVLFKIPAIRSFFADSRAVRNARKNARNTIRALKKLLKTLQKNDDDKYFALCLQSILREYCSRRFENDFEPLTTSEIIPFLTEIAGGELSELQEKGALLIYEIFKRCDYVRYANTGNSELFLFYERKELVNNAIKTVEIFETEEQEEADDQL